MQAIGPCRWGRLERYARWRQRRFRLLDLPDDVLAEICTRWLAPSDAAAVVEAVVGARPTLGCVAALPWPLRAAWGHRRAASALRGALRAMAPLALSHACNGEVVHGMIDWSPYRSVCTHMVPMAALEYSWASDGRAAAPSRRPAIALNSHVIDQTVRRCLRRRLPCVHVSLYKVFPTTPYRTILPSPLHAEMVQLYPHELLYM
jgi:hypothetical protein